MQFYPLSSHTRSNVEALGEGEIVKSATYKMLTIKTAEVVGSNLGELIINLTI